MVQNLFNEIGTLDAPASALASLDPQVKQMIRMIYKSGEELRNRVDWPELLKEATITLVDGTAAYAYPADFERIHFEASWNDDSNWPLYPLSPQEYEQRTRGGIGSISIQNFIAKGSSSTQFTVYPTPTAADAGQKIYFPYQSNYWTTSGAGDAATFASDSATSILPESLVEMGAKWRWKAENGLDYAEDKKLFYESIAARANAKTSSRSLSLVGGHGRHFIDQWNLPEGSWG
jgi:hypothetical protein